MRVLCVDDEQAALHRLVTRVLMVVPTAEVIEFEDAQAALSYLKESNQVDIAFLDIEMMDIDGISLAKEIKTINPTTKVIFVTGYDKYAIESYRIHMDGYILKPVTQQAIKEHIDYFFSQSDKIETICFGNFAMKANGIDIHFKRKKSLEYLALLVNERGGNVSTKQLIEVLFEQYNDSSRKMFSTIVSDAKSSLEAVGYKDVIVTSYGMYSIDTNKLKCDYYDALSADKNAQQAYQGQYMKQYKWAEKVNKALKGKF